MKSSPVRFYSALEVARNMEPLPEADTEESVFNFIIRFHELNTCSPTLEEIADFLEYIGFGTAWKSYAQTILEDLEKQGLIYRPTIPGKKRKAHGRIMVAGATWFYEGN